jgi:transposase-like protein
VAKETKAMTVDLTDPIFHDEAKAREWLEGYRWPNGPFCCHCGSTRVAPMGGKKHRPGLYYCPDCRGQFTVMTGSVMESSHVKIAKWVLAIRLMSSSKKGFSAHQLHRSIGTTYKTAWFMFHRLREAMSEPNPTPIGGEGKIVEADEAYHGKRKAPHVRNKYLPPPTKRGKGGGAQKRPIVALVERDGEARVTHMGTVTSKNIGNFMSKNVDLKSRLQTDESRLYDNLGKDFASHETVNHGAKEYVRGDVTTNTVEGFFGVFKRGMVGVYQHCGEQHFQRYLDEFTFRFNNRAKLGVEDGERAAKLAHGMGGKRLTYRRIAGQGEGMEGAGGSD